MFCFEGQGVTKILSDQISYSVFLRWNNPHFKSQGVRFSCWSWHLACFNDDKKWTEGKFAIPFGQNLSHGLSFRSRPPRALHHVPCRNLRVSPEWSKQPLNWFDTRFSVSYWAEIFTGRVSHQDWWLVKTSAQTDLPKGQIKPKGGGVPLIVKGMLKHHTYLKSFG